MVEAYQEVRYQRNWRFGSPEPDLMTLVSLRCDYQSAAAAWRSLHQEEHCLRSGAGSHCECLLGCLRLAGHSQEAESAHGKKAQGQ
jgi:hypothetical protein